MLREIVCRDWWMTAQFPSHRRHCHIWDVVSGNRRIVAVTAFSPIAPNVSTAIVLVLRLFSLPFSRLLVGNNIYSVTNILFLVVLIEITLIVTETGADGFVGWGWGRVCGPEAGDDCSASVWRWQRSTWLWYARINCNSLTFNCTCI